MTHIKLKRTTNLLEKNTERESSTNLVKTLQESRSILYHVRCAVIGSTILAGSGGGVLEIYDLEKELFDQVQTIDYYTTVLKIKGLDHMPVGFYYFGEFIEDPATIGHPVAMQRFFGDTNIFLFWSYGNAGETTGQNVTKFAIDAVKTMGGTVVEVILQRRFKYFPHVDAKDMKNGFYEKLEMNESFDGIRINCERNTLSNERDSETN